MQKPLKSYLLSDTIYQSFSEGSYLILPQNAQFKIGGSFRQKEFEKNETIILPKNTNIRYLSKSKVEYEHSDKRNINVKLQRPISLHDSISNQYSVLKKDTTYGYPTHKEQI